MEINYLKNMENNGNIQMKTFHGSANSYDWGNEEWDGQYIQFNSELGMICGTYSFDFQGTYIPGDNPPDVNTGNAAITNCGVRQLGYGLLMKWIDPLLDKSNIYFMSANNVTNIGNILGKETYVGANECKIYYYKDSGKGEFYGILSGSAEDQQKINVIMIGKPANTTISGEPTPVPTQLD